MGKKVIQAALPCLHDALLFIRLQAQVAKLTKLDAAQVELASEEVISNIIEHGYKGNEGAIEIECTAADTFQVKISDNAPPFDQTQTPPHDESAPFHNGRRLVHELLDSFSYERVCDKNILTLSKRV
jgi:serine/threonine-protein kinase RsbW